MSKLTVIIGLPGSGKTHLGIKMANESGLPFYDDCATETETWEAVQLCVQSDKDCIIADPGFCIERIKNKFLDKLGVINSAIRFDFIYFDNEPTICAENVSARIDGRTVAKRFAHDLSKWYTVPDGVRTIPCYRRNENVVDHASKESN